jgi:hypothetical protein
MILLLCINLLLPNGRFDLTRVFEFPENSVTQNLYILHIITTFLLLGSNMYITFSFDSNAQLHHGVDQ